SNANGLIIDPDIDMPPLYQKFHRDTTSERCLSINTIDLITELTPLSDPLLQAKSKLSPNLISHLILAWGIFSDRTFMRLDTHSELSICIGLSTSHFYLGDHLPFEDLVYGKDGAPDQIHVKTGQTRQDPPAKVGNSNFNKSTQTKLDAWDESLYGKKTLEKTSVSMESIGFHLRSGGKSQMSETGSDKEKYHNYRVNVLNMSPGGYCVEWNHLAPGSIKSGEIISVKGEHHNNWHIGVIRWVKQTKEKGLQLGIELISPSAAPYGAKFVALSGEDKTDFLRVLLLPEISAAGQAASIITPSLSFKPGQHIHLMLNGEEQTILLRELLTSTGSYSQFSFDTVKPLNSDSTSPWHSNQASDAGDIDSVWEIL
ncbi:MAG: hypothetical protein KAG18_00870, partial [Sinobacterium sp.]|nr:hypothetical protein [Sinobacterium sp.]